MARQEIPYEPLSSTSYGEPDGLFGINCHHKKYPFIDGVNFQTYFPYEKEENAKYYADKQEQRKLERRIREQKREIDMLNELGDTEGTKLARAKLKEQRKAYKDFSEKANLRMRSNRTAVVSEGSKNSGKGIDKADGSGIIRPYEIKKSRDERKAIIEKAKALERPIFVEDTAENKLASYARLIQPKENYYDVVMHGNPTYAEFFGEPIDAYTLASILKSRSDYALGTNVRLLSCSTGDTTNTGDCFAQLLANELGADVEAPIDDFFVLNDGTWYVGKQKSKELKHFWARK